MSLKKHIPFKIRYDLEDRTLKFSRFITGNLK